MKQRRFSIYMNEEDFSVLQELQRQIDPNGNHSRSQVLVAAIKVLLAMFKNLPEDDKAWQEAVKLGRSTAD